MDLDIHTLPEWANHLPRVRLSDRVKRHRVRAKLALMGSEAIRLRAWLPLAGLPSRRSDTDRGFRTRAGSGARITIGGIGATTSSLSER